MAPSLLKATAFLWALLSICAVSASEVVATCQEPQGYAFYPFNGHMKKQDSGFVKDAIANGTITLSEASAGNFDILYIDTTKSISSSVQDGAKVALLRRGPADATFLVYYPAATIELYTFYVDNEGKSRFVMMQSRGGDALIHKSGVMEGGCSFLDLSKATIPAAH